jgi:predicted CxxxxCH...CXXCH cytochrome family protein
LLLAVSGESLAAWTDAPLLHNSSRFACSKPGYYDQATCESNGGVWNPAGKWANGWGTDAVGAKYGPIDCATCHVKNAVNIKRVKQVITAPNTPTDQFPIEADGSAQPVSFLDAREGTADFGDDGSRPYGAARSDKICEACHSKTSYHNYNAGNNTGGNGHFNNSDCISCHMHKQGFRPAVCDSCHNASSALADSHGVHYNSATVVSGITTNNSSTAGNYVFQCGNCHNNVNHAGGAVSAVQAAEISIIGGGIYNAATLAAGADRGFSYTAGSCKTNLCHQDGRGGNANYNAATLVWTGSLPADCTGCHDNNVASTKPMATLAHTAHVNNANHGASKTCNTCHNLTVDGTDRVVIDKSLHVNGLYNIAILAAVDGNGATTNWTGASCNAIYCHSTGQSTTVANDPAPTYATATWATPATGDCGTCHKVTEVSGLTSGSHAAHLGTTMGTATVSGCGDCHVGAANDASSYNSALHVNKKINVSSTYNSATVGSGDPGDGYYTCAAASCHDDGTGNPAETPRWGTTVNDCTECHKSDMTSGSHAIHLTTTINDTTIGCGSCHADAVQGTTAPTTIHLNGLVNVYNAAVGDFGGDYTGATAKGGAPYGSCATTYCHGDTLKDRTDAGLDVSPLWGATLGSNGDNCDVCHGFPPDGAGSHPTSADCNACHSHTNATNNGFDDVTKHIDGTVQIDGGNNCLDCHGSGKYKDPNTNHPDHADHTDVYAFLAGKTLPNGDYGGAGWYSVTYNASGVLVAGCGQCHPGVQASHPSGGLTEIDLDPAGETITSPNAKLNNSSPSYASGKCANVYCHSDGAGTFVAVGSLPVWGVAAENLTCAGCHGNSPTTNAHGLHAVGIHYDTLYDDDAYGLMATSPTGKATSGGADAAHGNSSTSDTIGCQSCHYSTVTVEYNSGNSVCVTCHYSVPGTPATGSPAIGNALAVITASSSTHLNGAKTVAFQTMAGQKSKAQLRNDVTTVTELGESWARYNSATLDNTAYKLSASHDTGKRAPAAYDAGGKTCSTVDCHNGKQATWTDTNVSCNYCHTGVPK